MNKTLLLLFLACSSATALHAIDFNQALATSNPYGHAEFTTSPYTGMTVGDAIASGGYFTFIM